MPFNRTPDAESPWKTFINVGSTTVPPYSVIQITNAGVIVPDVEHLSGKLPTSTVNADNFAITDAQSVPVGGDGRCTRLDFAAVRVSGTAPAIDGELGPKAGLYTAEVGQSGLIYHGEINAAQRLAFVSFKTATGGEHNLVAKTDTGGIPARVGTTPGTATVEVYEIDNAGVLQDAEQVIAYNVSADAIAPSTYVTIHKTRGGKWVVAQSDAGGGGTIAKTPTGAGIAGRTGTTLPSAVCALYQVNDAGVLTALGTSEAVYNLSETPVPLNSYVKVIRHESNGKLVVWRRGAGVIAKAPTGGIAGFDVTVASAVCELFTIDGAGAPVTTGLSEAVYNLGADAIGANEYFPAVREENKGQLVGAVRPANPLRWAVAVNNIQRAATGDVEIVDDNNVGTDEIVSAVNDYRSTVWQSSRCVITKVENEYRILAADSATLLLCSAPSGVTELTVAFVANVIRDLDGWFGLAVVTVQNTFAQAYTNGELFFAIRNEEQFLWQADKVGATGGNEALVRFELTANLTLAGTSAAAETLDQAGVKTGLAITVRDRVGEWAGLVGYQGIAFRGDNAAGNYDIVFLEAKARWVRGELNADLYPGSAGANVLAFFGSAPNGRNPGAIVTVFDPTGLWFWGRDKDKIIAVYNEQLDRYEIAWIEFPADTFSVDLTNDGGLAGINGTQDCTLTYTVRNADSNDLLGNGISPAHPRPSMTQMIPATRGIAHWELIGGVRTLILDHAFEVPTPRQESYVITAVSCQPGGVTRYERTRMFFPVGTRFEAPTNVDLACGGSGTVTVGCGIMFDALGRLQVKNIDLAGSGLVTEGTCGIAVGPGCGITITTNGIAVNVGVAATTGMICTGGQGGNISVDFTVVTTHNLFAAGSTCFLGIVGNVLRYQETVTPITITENAAGMVIGFSVGSPVLKTCEEDLEPCETGGGGVGDNKFVFGEDEGIVVNSDTLNNTPALLGAITKASARAGGLDIGEVVLPAGKIRLTTEVIIDGFVGMTVRGRGATGAVKGPRNWGGSWTGGKIGGTQLYYDGQSGGGNVLQIKATRNFHLEALDVYLFESSSTAHASTGILWTRTLSSDGPGENEVDRVNFMAEYESFGVRAGTVGMRFGVSGGEENTDTFKCTRCDFKGLERAFVITHLQGMVWRVNHASFHFTNTFFHFEQGGNLMLSDWHCADNRSSINLTVCRADAPGINNGHYAIGTGYIDRIGTNQTVTIFDFRNSISYCTGTVDSVWVRNLTGTPNYSESGPAYFEMSNMAIVHARGGSLGDQPIVRWHTTNSFENRGFVVVEGAEITPTSAASIPRQLCTSTGGYNGQLYLKQCRAFRQTVSATVGVYPVTGNRRSHYDWQPMASAKTYDGIEGLETFQNSWLNATYAPAAHWKMDEALGATSLLDATGNGHTLFIDSVMQEAGAPIPWLERYCNFEKSIAATGRDSGISITPSTTPVILTGFVCPGTYVAGDKMFMLASGTTLRYQFGRMMADGGESMTIGHGGSTPFTAAKLQKGTWHHFLFYASGSTLKTYVDGMLMHTSGASGWNSALGGTLWIGGGPSGWDRGNYGLSRISVITGRTLTDVQAGALFRSATFIRERLGARLV